MAQRKDYLKITYEGLKLLLASGYASINEMNGFYGKEVFFSEGFDDTRKFILYQCIGNIGAYSNHTNLELDIDYIVLADQLIANPDSELYLNFVSDLEQKYNQANSPFIRMKLLAESDLINYLGNRAKRISDNHLSELLKQYKDQAKKTVSQSLF